MTLKEMVFSAKAVTVSTNLTNSGSITINGGGTCLDAGSNWLITNTNTGTFTISGASVALIDDGSDFDNFGTFKGNGTVENGNNNDVDFMSGSTLAPGTSVGQLTFTDILDLTEVNIEIEIDGASSFDKIKVENGIHGPSRCNINRRSFKSKW